MFNKGNTSSKLIDCTTSEAQEYCSYCRSGVPECLFTNKHVALSSKIISVNRLKLHHRILTLLIYCIVLYFSCISVRVCVQFYFERAHYLFIYLIDVYI